MHAIETIQSRGFVAADESADLYVNGEFTIALRGERNIDLIQIWFQDKDLRDRVY
ncbi:hypothetical protein [Paenibacillus antri]|uniref:hypothetical protein n=1 Tax=Paenibacillus antri TaxID=2582848 RepID=UPI0013051124|nr:hypothetical protein [Paenibacillus antri]